MTNAVAKSSVTNGPVVSVGGSSSRDPETAAIEFHRSLAMDNPACVIFYCCVDYDRERLAAALKEQFGDIPLMGCTTAGEILPGGITDGAITGFSLSADYFVVESSLIENLAAFSETQTHSVVRRSLDKLAERAVAPLEHNSFAMSMLDGMAIREELVLSALNSALSGIPLVGGSAGDNMHFRNTHVYSDGKFYGNAAVLIMVNTVCSFSVLSGHHLQAGKEKLVVTHADPEKRVAYEFNAEPAALEYCRISGLSLDQLCPKTFALHPLSVQIGDSSFVRSVQQVNDDLSLTFFCAIDNGIVLSDMESGDLVGEFADRMSAVVDEIGEPELVIGYDCIHRRIEMAEHGTLEKVSELYRRYKVIGFNTYGEHCDAMHINHTFTGIAIGTPEKLI